MIDPVEIKKIEHLDRREAERFRSFLETHVERSLSLGGKAVPYMVCGSGTETLLTFAGGWGGVDLAYDLILGLEGRNRVAVIDISVFDDPDELTRGIDLVCEREGIVRPVLFGQSFSGIPAQVYFRRRFERAGGLILVNTLIPRPERSKPWALALIKILPLGLFKSLARKKTTKLSELKREIPPEVNQRRKFAAGLLGRMIDTYWSRANLLNVLKIAFAFNKEGAPSPDLFAGWPGRVLVVTSEDEPYHPDAGLMMKAYPRTEMVKLPTGYGHTAPQILRDEFLGIVQKFLEGR
jgi:pimeloyl-ACP methyl ester carboxylesterase